MTAGDEEEKEPTNIEFTEQNVDPEIIKMLLTLDGQSTRRRRYCSDELHWELQKQVDYKNSAKWSWSFLMITVLYLKKI